MRRYNSTLDDGHYIGKADKYYTWWRVYEPHEEHHWYGNRIVQNFEYIQNLSYDKDKAIKKMEEFDEVDEFRIDESIQGNTSYSYEVKIDYKEDIFLFGQYKKKKFSEVDDSDYKLWYWRNTVGTDQESPVLRKHLDNLLIDYDGETILIDELKDKALRKFEEEFRRRGFFGEKGETVSRYVRLRDVRSFETTYGWMNVYEFVDTDGRLLFYKGSKELDIEIDEICILEGKIDHDKYYSKYHSGYVEETRIKYPKITKEEEVTA